MRRARANVALVCAEHLSMGARIRVVEGQGAGVTASSTGLPGRAGASGEPVDTKNWPASPMAACFGVNTILGHALQLPFVPMKLGWLAATAPAHIGPCRKNRHDFDINWTETPGCRTCRTAP